MRYRTLLAAATIAALTAVWTAPAAFADPDKGRGNGGGDSPPAASADPKATPPGLLNPPPGQAVRAQRVPSVAADPTPHDPDKDRGGDRSHGRDGERSNPGAARSSCQTWLSTRSISGFNVR